MAFVGLALAQESDTYAWKPESKLLDKIHVLQKEVSVERLSVVRLLPLLMRWWSEMRPEIVFIPSYSPFSSTILLGICVLTGTPAVMMNDTHAGTTDTAGWKMLLKHAVVRLFSAGLVAGTPHCRFFGSLGISSNRLRIGYDVVDNEYFAAAASRVRDNCDQVRLRRSLPKRFVLSLGRFVAKKNLGVLVRAYAALPQRQEVALVFVGAGEKGDELRALCAEIGLAVVDGPSPGMAQSSCGSVWFYEFQDIEALPDFYALAEAFVLPSRMEEWGLVVNEAMACATPIIVSRAAGCAEDLVMEGVTGRTFDPGSPKELTGVLEVLLSDREAAGALGRRGQAYVRMKFGCNRFQQSAVELATGLLKEKNGGGNAL